MSSPNLQYHSDYLSQTVTGPELQLKRTARTPRPLAAQSAPAPEVLYLNGVRILLALGLTIGLAGLFLWEGIRHWLFAP